MARSFRERSVGILALILTAALALEPNIAQASDANDLAADILAGISNQGRNQQQPYVTAGDRAYLIGTQDGNFPDMGHHVPGEMAGLWLPPIKLIGGFQARIAELSTDKEIPRCSVQPKERSIAHAKGVAAMAIFFRKLVCIAFLQYCLPLGTNVVARRR